MDGYLKRWREVRIPGDRRHANNNTSQKQKGRTLVYDEHRNQPEKTGT